jgi:hypothetical protein
MSRRPACKSPTCGGVSTLAIIYYRIVAQRDLNNSQKEKEENLIVDLYLKCKPYHEITKQTGLTKGRISQILNNFKTEKIKQIDLKPKNLQLFNVWNFGERDIKRVGGDESPLFIPGLSKLQRRLQQQRPFFSRDGIRGRRRVRQNADSRAHYRSSSV